MSYKIHHNELSKDLEAIDNQVPLDESPLPLRSTTHLIVAKKGSGKSSMVINMLKSKNAYNKKFDNIYLFSPTCRGDSKFDELVEELDEEGKVHDDLTPETLHQVLEEIKNFNSSFDVKKKKRQPLSLIIFDDCFHQLLKKGKDAVVLNKLITTARHYKTSLIFCIQRFKVSPLLRSNCDLVSIFKVTNKQELKEILDEWSIPEELYNIATHKPFGFLHVSYCAGGQPIYFSKFSRITFDEK